jgi:hypothetical protein
VKRRVTVAALAIALLGSAPPARADFPSIPGLPGSDLGAMIEILEIIRDAKLDKGSKYQDGLKVILLKILTTLARPFPDPRKSGLLRKLGMDIEPVDGIREEILKLACTWRVSKRTRLLRDLYLTPLQLCKSDMDAIWGELSVKLPSGKVILTTDPDLHEIVNQSHAVTSNIVSQRVQASENWGDKFGSMFSNSANLRVTPGEAMRDDALARAMTAEVEASNSQILAQNLYVRQIEDMLDRAEERGEASVSYAILAGLSSGPRRPR